MIQREIIEKPISNLKKITSYLLLNSSFLDDISLFHGKMGIVLFFSHYCRFSDEPIYEDFASKLIEEIYESIHKDLPINYEYGLCGIGWGIEYLVQNGFMDGNTDEILYEIDQKVIERDIRRIKDISFRKGIGGIAYYLIARMNAKRVDNKYSPFDYLYLSEFNKILDEKIFLDKENPKSLIYDFKSCLSGLQANLNLEIPECMFGTPKKKIIKMFQTSPGIHNGLAGFGLKKIYL